MNPLRIALVAGNGIGPEITAATQRVLAATGLTSANPSHQPTYPSWRPTRELDFICTTADITPVRFEILDSTLSDHLPLLCDLRIPGEA